MNLKKLAMGGLISILSGPVASASDLNVEYNGLVSIKEQIILEERFENVPEGIQNLINDKIKVEFVNNPRFCNSYYSAGCFDPNTSMIYIKSVNPLFPSVPPGHTEFLKYLIHEFAHAIDYIVGKDLEGERFSDQRDIIPNTLADYGYDHTRVEGFADGFSDYYNTIKSRRELKENHPEIYNYFHELENKLLEVNSKPHPKESLYTLIYLIQSKPFKVLIDEGVDRGIVTDAMSELFFLPNCYYKKSNPNIQFRFVASEILTNHETKNPKDLFRYTISTESKTRDEIGLEILHNFAHYIDETSSHNGSTYSQVNGQSFEEFANIFSEYYFYNKRR